VCVFLYTVFRLIVVLFCVMCVVCVLYLIVVPFPPGENPFAVKISIYLSEDVLCSLKLFRCFLQRSTCNYIALHLGYVRMCDGHDINHFCSKQQETSLDIHQTKLRYVPEERSLRVYYRSTFV
jgi:hypothetical protein